MKPNNSYEAIDIEVLEDQPVRKRPGMYIRGTDDKAVHHLALEIIIILWTNSYGSCRPE